MADSTLVPLEATGQRVRVGPPTHADVEPYRVAVEQSARRIGVWNPVNPRDLVHHLENQSDSHRTFLIRALVPSAESSSAESNPTGSNLVGVVNVSNVVRGRFMSATMGYNAFDPFAGTGMFGEGLGLVVGVALRDAPLGMGLHRVEANVRIGNAASAGALRALGFRRERTIRRMLWLADGLGGSSAWRDHDSYAVTRDEWPAAPYRDHESSAGVLVVGEAVPESVATALARELGGTALFGLPFEGALQVAQYSQAPVIWCAGDRADEAVTRLQAAGAQAARIDRDVSGCTLEARAVTRAALAVRPYLS